jgi:hypothetical protein
VARKTSATRLTRSNGSDAQPGDAMVCRREVNGVSLSGSTRSKLHGNRDRRVYGPCGDWRRELPADVGGVDESNPAVATRIRN